MYNIESDLPMCAIVSGQPVPPGWQVAARTDRRFIRGWRVDTVRAGISAFFPAYNDAGTIQRVVNDASKTLQRLTDDYEIILVDDGSADETGEVCDSLAEADSRVTVIHHGKNRGYGAALRSGFARARKELVFYTDGDGQYDVRELANLVAVIDDADVVNGYKIKRQDPTHRIMIGRIYCWMARAVFGLRIRDVNCDFRLIRRSVLDPITLESGSGAICVELMAKMQRAGARIREVPVHHYPRTSGKSQFFTGIRVLRLLRDLLRQHWRLRASDGGWDDAREQ